MFSVSMVQTGILSIRIRCILNEEKKLNCFVLESPFPILFSTDKEGQNEENHPHSKFYTTIGKIVYSNWFQLDK